MRYILFILAILCISPIFAEDIIWQRDINSAYVESLNSNKPMVVYLTMDNCVFCDRMEATTLRDPAVLRMLKRFVPVKLKNELQPSQVRLFNVTGFPTTFILTPRMDGERKILDIKHKLPGYVSSSQLIQAISSVR